MSIDELFRIGGPSEARTPRGDPTADSTEFRRLLERLESLSKPVETGSADKAEDDADNLADALRRAEDDFVAAMDLRRQLEEAFRRSQS